MKGGEMDTVDHGPGPVIFSVRLYQALLAMYPSGFRQEYGWQMLQVFGDCCRRALRQAGMAGLLLLWSRTLLDTVQTALEEHAQRGVDMSKQKFVKLSGWALVLGGPAIALGGLAASRPEYDRFNALSTPIDRYINALDQPLLLMGLLLLSAGFTGLLVRYGKDSGAFGRFTLGLAAISGVISAISIISPAINDNEYWWFMFVLSLTVLFLCATLFGLVCLQRKVMPRWNWLPLVGVVWLPLLYGMAPVWVTIPLWLLLLAAFVGLGYLLQSDAQPAGSASAAT
jgi:hypothetical protein